MPLYEGSPFGYSEAQVDDLLAMPAAYATGAKLGAPESHATVSDDGNTMVSYWGRQLAPEEYIGPPRISFDVGQAAEAYSRIYTGPVYLQRSEPTCTAWAIVHSMSAVGVMPTTALACDLLNAALPGVTQKEGLSIDSTARILEGHDAGVVLEALGSSERLSVPVVAHFIGRTLERGGAITAAVESFDEQLGSRPHEVCVAGYRLDERGHMNLQIIDSQRGECGMAVEDLTREINGQAIPLVAVINTPLSNVRI